MRSHTPKVLHTLAGRPMIDLILAACREAGVEDVTAVISPRHPEVAAHLDGTCAVAFQAEQRGTGHALAQVPAERLAGHDVLVLNGDLPLIRAETVARLLAAHRQAGALATLATAVVPGRCDGRVIRGPDGRLDRIVEHRDANDAERAVDEINVGLYCFNGDRLGKALAELGTANAAGEHYLTDVFRSLRPAEVIRIEDPAEAMGVNDRAELARAELALRERLLAGLMLSGVTVRDPASTFVDLGVQVGADTVIEPFTILRGQTVVGEGCRIGPFTEINDSTIGDEAQVEHSWLDGAVLGARSDCGPFAKLRPGAVIAEDVHIGSFGEVVRTTVGRGTKVAHVSYLGDAVVGEGVNIGAGTITANYDGERKNPTVIEDGASVGVDTMLRAPVRVGRGARTGAGAVVTRDVPPGVTVVGAPARPIPSKQKSQDEQP